MQVGGITSLHSSKRMQVFQSGFYKSDPPRITLLKSKHAAIKQREGENTLKSCDCASGKHFKQTLGSSNVKCKNKAI